jgi:hypothetical protein
MNPSVARLEFVYAQLFAGSHAGGRKADFF